jgi:putative colanic acid biosynthesis UDP-glucose lipid carrier transferase
MNPAYYAPQMRVPRIAAALERRSADVPWRRNTVGRWVKRALDLTIATPAAFAALPVMVAVAVAVRATSKGPILFRQQRIGLDGELFTLWKFRTMTATTNGVEHRASEVTSTDARLTPIGARLRDTRLDELPQLFQVLTGQMSLVGPRPDIAANLPAYADDDGLIRFAMPPGCTAWTFTRGAFENDWRTRQAINVEYVRRWTPWLDVKILVGTVRVLLQQRATAPTVAEAPAQQVTR